MKFLDRLVSDLVRRQTGYDARRIVRRIGGKRILLLGGAALVGGMMAAQRSGGFAGGASSTAGTAGKTVVPPRSSAGGSAPPAPGSAGLPPLPPLPPLPGTPPIPPPGSGAASAPASEDAEDVPPDLLYAILRTMIAAALADGELHPDEKRLLDERIGESGLPEHRLAQLRRDLVIPAGPAELAQSLPNGDDPEVLARFAVLVAGADHEVVAHERAWLGSLERALGLPAGRTAELEREIFPAGA